MRSLIIILCYISFGIHSNTSVTKSPTQLTKEFIQDYKVWNDKSHIIIWDDTLEDNHRELYLELIAKYCIPNKEIGSTLVSEISEHSLEFETILEEKILDKKAIVYSHYKHHTITHMNYKYEYHFLQQQGKWLLEEVYVVENGTKYPKL